MGSSRCPRSTRTASWTVAGLPVYDEETWEIIDGDYLDFDHYEYPESGTDKQVNFGPGQGFVMQDNNPDYACFLLAPYEL